MLRAAIIGCGGIAAVHKKVLTELSEVRLVACADVIADKARRFAEGTEMNVYDNIRDLVDKEKPDVVHLCVPHPLHTPMAKYLTEKGIHVFTEKPPAVNPEQWKTFCSLAEGNSYVGICFQNRYNHSVQKAKEIIGAGKYGRIMGARAFLTWNRPWEYYSQSDWRGNWTTEGGGVLINQAIHTLDLLVYLLGKATDVNCHMSNHSLQDTIEVEDTVEAYISFESGINACFYATNAYCTNAPVMIEIALEKAVLRVEGDDLLVLLQDGSREQIERNVKGQFEKAYWGNSHFECIKDFYGAIIEKRSFANDIESVKDTMDLMIKMYEPFTGRKIPVS